MIIDVKYNVGDKVKWKSFVETKDHVTCPFCGGKNVINGEDGSQMICPRCYGNGNIVVEKEIDREGSIIQILVSYNSNEKQKYIGGPEILYNINGSLVDQSRILEVISDDN